MIDAIFAFGCIAGYGLGMGVAFFFVHRTMKNLNASRHDIRFFTTLGTVVWPLVIPAIAAYTFLYRRTDEYRQKQIDRKKEELDRLESEIEKLEGN